MEVDKQKYGEYAEEITLVYDLPRSMACVPLMGGTICAIGQFITDPLMDRMGMEQEPAAMWNLLALIFLSIVLTKLNIYPKIVKFGGTGVLVPTTRSVNLVVASAIEFHAKGEVLGVGRKIFIIVGPVILYGVLTSWVLGLIYWVGGWMGIFQLQ